MSHLTEPSEIITRTLDSTIANIDRAEGATLDFAQRAGFLGNELEKVGLAVREVVANAVIHGNRLDYQKKIVLTFLRTPDELKVAVWDQGAGFDLDGLPDLGFGQCVTGNDPNTADGTFVDSDVPGEGSGFFYLKGVLDGSTVRGLGVTSAGYTPSPGPSFQSSHTHYIYDLSAMFGKHQIVHSLMDGRSQG